MRFSLVLISCLLIPNLLAQEAAQSSSPRSPVVEREEKEFNFFPGGKIEIVAAVTGSLKIVGWKKGSVRVESEKIIYSPSQEQAMQPPQDQRDTAKPQLPIRIRYTQTSAAVRTYEIPGSKMEINLTLYVPGDKTDINAKIKNGDFSIEGINGWVEVTIATEGSLEAKSMAGYFSCTCRATATARSWLCVRRVRLPTVMIGLPWRAAPSSCLRTCIVFVRSTSWTQSGDVRAMPPVRTSPSCRG